MEPGEENDIVNEMKKSPRGSDRSQTGSFSYLYSGATRRQANAARMTPYIARRRSKSVSEMYRLKPPELFATKTMERKTTKTLWEEKVALAQITNALRRTDDDFTKVKSTKKKNLEPLRSSKPERTKSIIPSILPNCIAKRVWDKVLLVLAIYTIIGIPFDLGFGDASISTYYLLMDGIFMLDVLLNFRLAYVDIETLVDTFPETAIHYLHGWFTTDFLGAFPFEVFVPSTFSSNVTKGMFVLRCLRLFRIGKLILYIRSLGDYKNAIKVTQLFIAFAILTHWMACLFFTVVTSQDGAENGWHVSRGIDTADVKTQYISAAYAGVLVMIGEDISPQTNAEKVFAILFILFGAGIFAILFGQIGLVIQNLNKAENAFRQKLEIADENMRQMDLPRRFRERVRQYFDYCWNLNKCMPREEFLNLLSPALASELQLHFHLPILTAKLFNGTSPDFLIGIITSMKTCIYLRDDYVIKEGEVGTDMYFIERGTCHVTMASKPGQLISTITTGEYFGEMGTFANVKRSASIRAATCCNVAIIGKHDFDVYFKKYPLCALAVYRNIMSNSKYLMKSSEERILRATCSKYEKHYQDMQVDVKAKLFHPIKSSSIVQQHFQLAVNGLDATGLETLRDMIDKQIDDTI